MFAEGVTWQAMMKETMFSKVDNIKPNFVVPSQKKDLKIRDINENFIIWLGHSSYYLQMDGKSFLIDPILSGHASPFWFTIKNFKGSNPYSADDFPEIDYLIITHNHWDHLDYKTLIQLHPKIKTIITGLVTGAHLEHWKFNQNLINELDWNEKLTLENGFEITAVPARHFSGRLFKRNQILWTSFVLKTPSKTIFINGDSGRDYHYKEIGDKFGPFDLAIMECGQYNYKWPLVHHFPEEVVQSIIDLKAVWFIPGHWGKFALAKHPWDESINRVIRESEKFKTSILTPIIGDIVNLDEKFIQHKWWN